MQSRLRIFYPPQRAVLIFDNKLITVPLSINDEIVMDCRFFAIFEGNDQVISVAG